MLAIHGVGIGRFAFHREDDVVGDHGGVQPQPLAFPRQSKHARARGGRDRGSEGRSRSASSAIILTCPHDTGQQHLLEEVAGRASGRRVRAGPRRENQCRGHHRRRLDQRPSLQQPGAQHQRPAGRAFGRTRRAGPGRRRAGGVRRADSRDSHRRLQPGVARRRRGLLRDRPLRPSRRCDDRDLGLRQDRRRRADAAGADQCVRPGALSGHQLARQGGLRRLGEQRHQPHDHGLRRGPGRPGVRPDLGRRAARARTQRHAGQRHLRRDVHGQHDEHDRRVDRHDAAARRLAPRRLRCQERHPRRRPGAGARVGRCLVPADRRRHSTARHHDRARLRERHNDGLRHGRLDQHVSASAGHRAAGRSADHDRTHPAGRRAGTAAGQPAAARPVCDGEPACDRRRADRDEGAAGRGPAAWRRDDRHRQDPGGKPRRGSDAGGTRPVRTSSFRSRARSRRRTITSAC